MAHHHRQAHYIQGITPRRHLVCILLSFFLLLLFIPAALIGAQSSRGFEAPASLQPCGSNISPGDTMACAINATAEIDSIAFNAASGDIVLVRVGVTSGTMTPYVRVVGPSGAKLCEQGNTYSSAVEIARCALSQSGSHAITVADAAGTRVGSYNLYLQRLNAPSGATSLIVGETLVSSIATAAEATSYTLAANANDVVLLRAGVTAGAMTPLIRVFGSDGMALCNAGTSYSAGAEITRCALPQTGSYTILVGDAIGTRSGTYNLYLQQLNHPAGASALVAGDTRPTSLQAAEADTFTLTATAGDVLVLRAGVTAGTMTPIVRVFDTNGIVLCNAGTSYSAGAEISRCLLPQTGSYAVLVSDALGTRTGSYNLYFQSVTVPVDASVLDPGVTINGTIPAAAAMQTYTLDGRANEAVLLRAGVTAGTLTPVIAIYDPDGVRICDAGTSYSPSAEISRCLLPRDGRYTILAGDVLATRTGSYNLFAQRLSHPITLFPLASGDSLAESIDGVAAMDAYAWVAGDHDTIQVRVAATSGGLHPLVRVFDPDGVLVCKAGTSYSVTADTGVCPLPRGGAYTIVVADAATQTGEYRLSLICLGLPCGAAKTARIDSTGGQVMLGQLHIDVAPNAVTEPLSVTLALFPGTPGSIVAGDETVRLFFVGTHTLAGQIVDQAQLPLQYTMRYSDADLEDRSANEAHLGLIQWDAPGHLWVLLAGQVDEEVLLVTVQSTRIGNLGLTATSPGERRVFVPIVSR